MEILQWAFIVGISLAIISLIFILYFIASFISQGKGIKKAQPIKTKNKRKKKKLANELDKMKVKRKKARRNIIIFLLLAVSFAGGSYYITYYQSTNLSVEDTQNITDGFYYLRDLQQELEAIQSGETDEAKSKQTITFIVTSLAGYSVKKANTLNTIEGQRALNRYYSSMSELGINISRRATQLYTDPDVIAESLTDIEKTTGHQRQAFKFFKVDESALQSEK